jgi:CheY-like chemotaxis protein
MTDVGKRVLIVEDHPGVLDTLRLNVSRLGVDIDVAQTREEALERVRRRAYHVAMIDVNLTDYSGDGMDRSGLEVVRAINASGEGTSCIVISGEPGSEVPVDAHEAGISKYIIKRRIRNSDDYVDVVRDLLATTELRVTGRFEHLNAYLARPDMRDSWESQALRVLRCDVPTLNRVLQDALGAYLPILRRRNSTVSFSMDPAAGCMHGVFWSRAVGGPIFISVARSGASVRDPDVDLNPGSAIRTRRKGAANFSVWPIETPPRDEFIGGTRDIA